MTTLTEPYPVTASIPSVLLEQLAHCQVGSNPLVIVRDIGIYARG